MDIIEIKNTNITSRDDLVKKLRIYDITLGETSLDQFWHKMRQDNYNLIIGLDCSNNFTYCNIMLVPAAAANAEVENTVETLVKLDADKTRRHCKFLLNSL